MADFYSAYQNTVAKWEGNYDTDPNDSGNWSSGEHGVGYITGTKCGLTAQDFRKVYGRLPSADEMKNLNQQQIDFMYSFIYWAAVRGNDIKNQPLANELFDTAVNQGIGDAIRYAKTITNQFYKGETVMDDITLNKLNGDV